MTLLCSSNRKVSVPIAPRVMVSASLGRPLCCFGQYAGGGLYRWRECRHGRVGAWHTVGVNQLAAWINLARFAPMGRLRWAANWKVGPARITTWRHLTPMVPNDFELSTNGGAGGRNRTLHLLITRQPL